MKGSAKGAPFLSPEESTSRDRDLMGFAGKGGTPDLPRRTPLAPPLLSTRVFCFLPPVRLSAAPVVLTPALSLLLVAVWRQLPLTLQPRAAF